MKIWRPYTQMFEALAVEQVASAENAYLHLANGRRVLDGISSWWVITHGHCQPHIVEAIRSQALQLDQVVFANFAHEAAERLTNHLGDLLPPELNSVFYSDNGSTAVEAAMKMACQFWQQSDAPLKKKFLAFTNSYHGDTCGAMSVTADGAYTRAYNGLRFEVIRCEQGQRSTDSLEIWLSDFRRKIASHHHEIAAVILEPLVQGAGGMIVWPRVAVQEIVQLCRSHDILVIFDEVMTAFGRTGTLFAFEQIGVIPDFLCLSKGVTGGFLPLGLTVTTDRIYEAFLSPDVSKMLFHGHSFTGNALSCAAACANLELFKTTDVIRRIEKLMRAHQVGVASLSKEIEVRDTRVIGAIGAIELAIPVAYGSQTSRLLFQGCLHEGLYLRPLGNVVYLMPPYCTSPDELERAWSIVAKIARRL